MRYFNTEGLCRPEEHYMVRLDERLGRITKLYVDRKKYFVINKGRQYGKTTTLRALAKYLDGEYIVFSLDFQQMGTRTFEDETTFSRGFLDKLLAELRKADTEDKVKLREMLSDFKDKHPDVIMYELFVFLSSMCERCERPVILMVDEVDSASNNQVFIDFLAQLRGYYLARSRRPFFHSVILAGVYDIKNLKLKIRPNSEHQYNSPWNIAADFDVTMRFSSEQIQSMLNEYQTDHQTEMDIVQIANEIYQYTSGYPYLVSALCKIVDEKLSGCKSVWTREYIVEAVKILLGSRTTLFDSLTKHLSEFPEMKQMLYTMLFQGEQIAFNQYNHTIELACMFGYVIADGSTVRVANRIFEICLYNLFLSEEELANAMSHQAKQDKSQFLSNGRLSELLSPRQRHLLSFNFNQKKETGVKTITVGEKTIVEAVV